MKKRAYIFMNGELLGRENFYKEYILKNEGDLFCADGGANFCHELGFLPKEIWGDLDSINPVVLEYYSEKKVIFKKFSSEKDYSDSELLIEYLSKTYDEIFCIAALGGSIDHELTNINLMTKFKNLFYLKEEEVLFLIDKEGLFCNLQGRKISFVIFSEKVKGLLLEGFKYNLDSVDLFRGKSRLISNIIISKTAKINFEDGIILCVLKNKIDR